MGFRKAGTDTQFFIKCRRYRAKNKKCNFLWGEYILIKIKEDGIKGRYKILLILDVRIISFRAS